MPYRETAVHELRGDIGRLVESATDTHRTRMLTPENSRSRQVVPTVEETRSAPLAIYQVHAFSAVVHGGNPAGVCVLDKWLDDRSLALIARDLGPSVTAFVLTSHNEDHALRWFTRRGVEVESFCGHATFSAGHVLLRLKEPPQRRLRFRTVSGTRIVGETGEHLYMTVPTWPVEECECPEVVLRSLGQHPARCFRSARDYMVVFDRADDVARLEPDYAVMRPMGHSGLIATAQRGANEVVLRFFCPGFSLYENEDHATGSAMSTLVPYWASRLGTRQLSAFQLSLRGGFFHCSMEDGVVTIESSCATFLSGTILP
jgi:predicted PhzF superfamily epimerase YddE/YHI9